jgi:hypothetical protein
MRDPREEEEGERSRRSQRRDQSAQVGSQNILNAQELGIPNSQSGGKPGRLGFSEEGEKMRWRRKVMRSSHGVTQGDEESIGWKTKKVRVRVRGRKDRLEKKVTQGDEVRRPSPSIVSSNSSESSTSTLVCSVMA